MNAEKVEKVEKGLAFCNSRAICSKCNYRLTEESEKTCDDILHADALDVICELKAENERMMKEKTDAKKQIIRMAEETLYTPAKTETDGIYLSGKYWGMRDALGIINKPPKEGEM